MIMLTARLQDFWTSPVGVRLRDTCKGLARMLLPRRATSGGIDSLQQPNGAAFYIGLVIVILALTSSLISYAINTGLTPIAPTDVVVRSLLLMDLFWILALLIVVVLQVAEIWRARVRQSAGARLHVQIVGLISIVAFLPAILLVVIASTSLSRALDNLLSKKTEAIVINSLAVAQAYLQEHGQVIRSDILAMANDLDERAALYRSNPEQFQAQFFQQAQLRNLPGAYLIDGAGKVLVAGAAANMAYQAPPKAFLVAAAAGDVSIVPPHDKLDQVGALQKLPSLPDTFLYVFRDVNGLVLQEVRDAQIRASEFLLLKQNRVGTELAYGILHMQLALTLLLSAIWVGMWFANILVGPIRRLIAAANTISHGNLDVRLPYIRAEGDLASLSMTFNTMASELKKQRDDLVNANAQLSERGRFIEAVLSGVSAGVIGLDSTGKVTLANRSAAQLLGRGDESWAGRPFAEVLPEMAATVDRARNETRRDRAQEQVDLTIAGAQRHFIVQVTREHGTDRDYGYVVTIDDMTGLVTAQRTSAWADVARRIAHEIKNPLTPIQLSAERLKRKYSSVIKEDREIFDKCTDTIIRQVGDLGRIVDEFSSFAKLPKPQMELQDLRDVVRQAVDLFQLARSDIDFIVTVPDQPVSMLIDRRLLSQAITNLVKNATEAIQSQREQSPADAKFRGQIEAAVTVHDGTATVSVIDNGCGLPKKDRNRLVEPYMTTRAKGTGIGLAVVHRVTEQHGGSLVLEDAPLTATRAHGAAIRMLLPITPRSRDTVPTDGLLQPGVDQAAE
jgi:two-component system nitrogen regulation sensor histidine kinase NtrY